MSRQEVVTEGPEVVQLAPLDDLHRRLTHQKEILSNEKVTAALSAPTTPAAPPATLPPSSPTTWCDLPPAILGGIFQLAAHADTCALAALNLTCHALHDALPEAFTLEDGFASAKSSLSHAFNREALATWPPDSDAPPPAASAVLHFNLSSSAFASLHPAALLEAMCSIGRRFAAARSLRLSLSKFSGHGERLFAEHIAPQMRSVRRLFLTGVQEHTLRPLWLEPTVVPLARSLRELYVSGHYRPLAALASQLPAAFPALTALHLLMLTRAPRTPHPELTLLAPPGLRVLLLSIKDGTQLGRAPSELCIAGSPTQLRQLKVHTCNHLTGSRQDFSGPLALTGCLPALRELDLTVSTCYGGGRLLQVSPATCPALTMLVLRTGARTTAAEARVDAAAWGDAVGSLAPLADSLLSVELRFGMAWVADCRPFPTGPTDQRAAQIAEWRAGVALYREAVRAAVMPAAALALPSTRVSIVEVGECRALVS